MLEQIHAYRAIIEEGDGRRRKNGGSPRANLGVALSFKEAEVMVSEFVRLRQISPHTRLLDQHTLSWAGLWEVGAVILHGDATKRQIGHIHMLLERAGLHNDTTNPLRVTKDQLAELKIVGKARKA